MNALQIIETIIGVLGAAAAIIKKFKNNEITNDTTGHRRNNTNRDRIKRMHHNRTMQKPKNDRPNNTA